MGFLDEIVKLVSENVGSGERAAGIRLREAITKMNANEFSAALKTLDQIKFTQGRYADKIREARGRIYERKGTYEAKENRYRSALDAFRQAARHKGENLKYPLGRLCYAMCTNESNQRAAISYLEDLMSDETAQEALFISKGWDFNACVCLLARLYVRFNVTSLFTAEITERAFQLHDGRGRNHMQVSDWAKAVRELEDAQYLKPGDLANLDALAESQFRQGLVDALQTLEKMTSVSSYSKKCLLKWARAAMALKQYEVALKVTKRLLAKAPKSKSAIRIRVKSLIALKRHAEACNFMEQTPSAQLMEEYGTVVTSLHLILCDGVKGAPIDRLSDSDYDSYLRGSVMLRSKQYAEARKAFSTVRNFGFPSHVAYYIAIADIELNKLADAREQLKRIDSKNKILHVAVLEARAFVEWLDGRPLDTIKVLEIIPKGVASELDCNSNLLVAQLVLLRRQLPNMRASVKQVDSILETAKKAHVRIPSSMEALVLYQVVTGSLASGVSSSGHSKLGRLGELIPKDPVVNYLITKYRMPYDADRFADALDGLEKHEFATDMVARARVEVLWRHESLAQAVEACSASEGDAREYLGPANWAVLQFAFGHPELAQTSNGFQHSVAKGFRDGAGEAFGHLVTFLTRIERLTKEPEYSSTLTPEVLKASESVFKSFGGLFRDSRILFGVMRRHLPDELLLHTLISWISKVKSRSNEGFYTVAATWLALQVLSGKHELNSKSGPWVSEVLKMVEHKEIKVSLLLQQARVKFDDGEYNDAISSLVEVTDYTTAKDKAYHGLALVYEAQENWVEAYDSWKKYLEHSPGLKNNPQRLLHVHERAAAAASGAELWAEAAEYWRKIWAQDENNDTVFQRLVGALLSSDQNTEAGRLVDQRLKKPEAPAGIRLLKVRVMVNSDRLPQGVSLMAKLLKRYPQHQQVLEEFEILYGATYEPLSSRVKQIWKLAEDTDQKIESMSEEEVNYVKVVEMYWELLEELRQPLSFLDDVSAALEEEVDEKFRKRHFEMLEAAKALERLLMSRIYDLCGSRFNQLVAEVNAAYSEISSMSFIGIDLGAVNNGVKDIRSEIIELRGMMTRVHNDLGEDSDSELANKHRENVNVLKTMESAVGVRILGALYEASISSYNEILREIGEMLHSLKRVRRHQVKTREIRAFLINNRKALNEILTFLSGSRNELQVDSDPEWGAAYTEFVGKVKDLIRDVDHIIADLGL